LSITFFFNLVLCKKIRLKKMPKIQTKNIELYYEIHGSGFPLILVCGFTNQIDLWKNFIPKLASKYQVIVFDNRGAGRSESSPPPYTIDQLADDTIDLMNELNIEKAHMVGFSMGTLILQSIAHRHAEKIVKGVLIAPFASLPSTALMQARSMSKLFGVGVDPALALETMLPWVYSSEFLSTPQIAEKIVKLILSSPYPQTPEGFSGQLEALASFDMSDRLDQIETPLLLLAGEDDLYTPLYEAEKLQKLLQNATLKAIPKVGHMLHIERQDLVIGEIDAFCQSK